MIKKEILSNVHLKKYFDSEIKVLELCDHPNIIKLNEHFPNLGIYVLVLIVP
jgi:serine/threonine protein kinase